MLKRLKALFMTVILVALTVTGSVQPVTIVKAATELTINVHYHRYADDYDGWNIWSWSPGADGAAFEFSGEDDFGKVATYTLSIEDDTTQIGFIVRQSTDSNAWNLKDTPNDRFIDIAAAEGGVIDIYVVQDDVNFAYSKEAMSLAPKLLAASVESSTTIDFKVTTVFNSSASDIASKVTVTDEDGVAYAAAGIASTEGVNATSGTITMEQELNLFKKYTLTFEGYGEMAVSNVKVFSTEEFEEAFYYEGDDLGAIWSKEKTNFRVWAPTAAEVFLNLYTAGVGTNLIESKPMTKDVKGTWVFEKTGDLNGTYYTYSVTVDGTSSEAVDPYAKAVGVNGDRGMIVDLDSSDPEGFAEDTRPELVNSTDAIIYELHIRDFSVDKSSGMKNRGKYLAFTETGTSNAAGDKTGIDYLVDLGVNVVHLNPAFDFASIDETKLINNQFNWGYDPKNYNVPEGSYSTDPQHGEVRIKEYKQMVQSLHEKGIRVVMDVVYNHTSSTDSNLNRIVPGYYYRMNNDGTYSNGSGCGNETASERAMMRKFIVDSVVYWVTEYHVDGFRFDLMGLHDVETMNAVREALNAIDPTIMVYGEGWTGGGTTLPSAQQVLKANMPSVDSKIAAFSDDIRDGIKGSVFDSMDQGFVTGKAGMEESIKFGIIAGTENSQLDYSLVNYSDAWWAKEPTQTITYASAHDNNTLWDKINISNAADSIEDKIKMNLLSCAIVLTSQGTPFFLAGEEFLRSKPMDETGTTFSGNSYNLPDSVNSLKWNTITDNMEVTNFYKGMIAFRKAHSALRMAKTSDIQANLTFLEGLEANVIAYTINNSPNGETAKALCMVFNANKTATTVAIPEGEWNVYVKGDKAGTEILETISGSTVTVDPISALVLVQEDAKAASAEADTTDTADTTQETITTAKEAGRSNNTVIYIVIVVAVVALGGVGAWLFLRRRNEKN